MALKSGCASESAGVVLVKTQAAPHALSQKVWDGASAYAVRTTCQVILGRLLWNHTLRRT